MPKPAVWFAAWMKSAESSHVTLYLGNKLSIVRNPKDELKTGTLHAMLRQ